MSTVLERLLDRPDTFFIKGYILALILILVVTGLTLHWY